MAPAVAANPGRVAQSIEAGVPPPGPAPVAGLPIGGLPVPAEEARLALLPPSPLTQSGAAKSRRISWTLCSFLLVVVLPTAVAAVYYLLIAAGQYVVEFRFGLRSFEPPRSGPEEMFSGSSTQLRTVVDSYAVAQYIGSRAILDDLGHTLDLRRIYSTKAADWPARLHLPVTVEELVAYWRRQVDAFFDPTNGSIAVRVRAFAPGDALAVAQGVLAASERLVNALSARARRDALRNSEHDVRAAVARLSTALIRLQDYRDKEGLIDPRKSADATAALAERLRDELTRDSADLSTLRQYMQADAPPLKILEARIDTLKAQRRALESEVTDTAATRRTTLSQVMGSYEEIESERRFAETAYQHALEALDRARMNADRQQVYVADFVPPRLPEEALYPRRLRALGIVFLAAFVIWAIGGLTVRSIADHL